MRRRVELGLKTKTIKAFAWDVLNRQVGQGVTFFVLIFLAREVSQKDFGTIAIVTTIVSLASVFIDAGLTTSIVQKRKVLGAHLSSVFYFNMLVALIFCAALMFSAPYIARFYNNPDLVPVIEVMSVLFIINASSSVQKAKLRKELEYATLTKASVVSAIISGIIAIIVAKNGFGVWSLVWQNLILSGMTSIILWVYSKWLPQLCFSMKALSSLWRFGLRIFISSIIDLVYTRLDVLIVGKVFTPSILGEFQVSKNISNLILKNTSGSLVAVVLPMSAILQNDIKTLARVYEKLYLSIIFVTFLVGGLLCINSKEVIVIMLTKKWISSAEYLKFLVISGAAYPINALLVNILAGRGNSKAFLNLEIAKKIIGSMNLLVLVFYGLKLFLYGLIITAVSGLLLNMAALCQELKISFFQQLKFVLCQALLAIAASYASSILGSHPQGGSVINLASKSSLYIFMYFFISSVFKFKSYQYVKGEAVGLFRNRLKTK